MKFKEAAKLFKKIDSSLYVASTDNGETMICNDSWDERTTSLDMATVRTLRSWEGRFHPRKIPELTLTKIE